MQITKSTETKVEKAIVPFKEQVKEIPQKVGKFFASNRKRAAVITASVFVIVAAIGINWMLFGQNNAQANGDPSSTEQPNDTSKTPASDVVNGTPESSDSFFALAVTDRQRARDEALEVLQTVVASSETSSEEKTAASVAISKIASYIEAEANIETLVKGKGFAKCVAVISDDTASVIVGTESTLMANELAQIKEIIYLQTGIDPSGMRISEKIITSESSSGTNNE